MNQNKKSAVILFSGGLDSSTLLAIANHQQYDLYPLSFNYGQRHICELERAKDFLEDYPIIDYKSITIDLRMFGHSALTDNIDVPCSSSRKTISEGIPITYVPARNTIFLSYGLAWAEVLGASAIFIGVNHLDYSGYPDCRPEYLNAFNTVISLATKKTVEGSSIKIKAPLLHLTKAEIILQGIELGIDYSKTHSCYNPNIKGEACRYCDSCLLRKKGFQEANIPDPTIYTSI